MARHCEYIFFQEIFLYSTRIISSAVKLCAAAHFKKESSGLDIVHRVHFLSILNYIYSDISIKVISCLYFKAM